MINPHEKTELEIEHKDSSYNETMPDSATLSDPAAAATPQGVSITDIAKGFAIDLGDAPPELPVNRDGTPKRKPGRPRKMKPEDQQELPGISGPVNPAPQTAPKTPAARKANRVASDELARAILNLSVGSLSALVGPEWDFNSTEEAQGMKGAVSAYIEAKGDGQLSPEALLALVVASYAMPRFAHENTRTKMGGFFSGLWNGVKSIFKR